MAEMLQARKLPVLADIQDESAEDIRIVLEPKSRRLDPEAVMESLFKLTELESRISLNLNVLDSSGRPSVLSLKDALKEWLAHRRKFWSGAVVTGWGKFSVVWKSLMAI